VNGASWTPQPLVLWPTLISRCELADHDTHDSGLIALIEKMDREAEQMTSRYQATDVLALDHPDIRWLYSGIESAVRTYFKAVGLDYEIGWQARGWPNVNRRGDYHSPHNHGWSYLSGTYYVRVPSQPETTVTGAAAPAAISFYDPRAAVNMLALGDEAVSRREQRFDPGAGTMLLWNAFLNHSVHPNLAEETRLSISFNISLTWSDRFVGA
jgi:uncharacterized protein (TIGR02466 family)